MSRLGKMKAKAYGCVAREVLSSDERGPRTKARRLRRPPSSGFRQTAISQARGAVGWYQQTLSAASGVPFGRVQRIEYGDQAATTEDQAALAAALGTTIEALFDDRGFVRPATVPKQPEPRTKRIWVCGRGWPKVTLARLTAGLTMEQLAEAVGVDRRKIRKIERVGASASPAERKAIAKALGVAASGIFKENGFTAFLPKYNPNYRAQLLPIPATRLYSLRKSRETKWTGSLRLALARAAELPGGVDEYLTIERRETIACVEACEAIAAVFGKPVEELFSPLGLALL